MSVKENLHIIQDQIAKAAEWSERASTEVELVAVSKVQPEGRVREALEAGQRVFGENRVQEAKERWVGSGWRTEYPDLKLHLIGPLQTNKAGDAVALFDVIQTLDREKLARALCKEMDKQGRKLPCFIQVNTGEEPQKAGILPHELDDFYAFCTQECALDVIGLMCIPPVDEPSALHFAFLRKLAKSIGVAGLSMGMSDDFAQGVALGASHIRVGSAIFGARD
ncbi:MAG: YggS family pyridoxal phosphate-dependent enzyme [Micavibrio sp.]|nr:YggS family pyridoxal phosphate-dependent enzyme [Micavibrio sp.]